jgi:hypothetical protein
VRAFPFLFTRPSRLISCCGALSVFSNVLTKSTIETLAQADEFEMVREVQVRCLLPATSRVRPRTDSSLSFCLPFAGVLCGLPDSATVALHPLFATGISDAEGVSLPPSLSVLAVDR